jgi:hypothetical protein
MGESSATPRTRETVTVARLNNVAHLAVPNTAPVSMPEPIWNGGLRRDRTNSGERIVGGLPAAERRQSL